MKQRRKRKCRYGVRCRNINDRFHRQQYMHPCKYGASCTKLKDEYHLQDYFHSSGGGGKGKGDESNSSKHKSGGKKLQLGDSKETLEIKKNFYVGLFGPRLNKEGSRRVSEKVPDSHVQNRIRRDGHPDQHITVVIKPEMHRAMKYMRKHEKENELFSPLLKKYHRGQINELFLDLAGQVLKDDWKALGIGNVKQGNDDVYFVVCEWPSAQEFRKMVGLEEKDFHITIGFAKRDLHNVCKGKKTLCLEF